MYTPMHFESLNLAPYSIEPITSIAAFQLAYTSTFPFYSVKVNYLA